MLTGRRADLSLGPLAHIIGGSREDKKNASNTTLQPVISLVNRVVRIMTFAPYGNIDVDSIYKYLDIPNVLDTISLETGKFMFKKENGLLPLPYIANHFEIRLRSSNVFHRYNLRNRGINMPTISQKSSHGEKSIQFRGAKLWNSLPQELIRCENLRKFKKDLKSHLLEDISPDDDDVYYYY